MKAQLLSIALITAAFTALGQTQPPLPDQAGIIYISPANANGEDPITITFVPAQSCEAGTGASLVGAAAIHLHAGGMDDQYNWRFPHDWDASGNTDATQLTSNGDGSSFLRQSALANLLRISVEQGSNSDEAVVLFYESGLAGRDAYDADNLAGSGLDISTSAAGMVLATNVMPELSARYEVPVIVRVPNGNQVAMRFTNLESFDPGTRIYVRDAFAGTFTEVTAANNTVIFSMGQNPAAQNGRFTLVFSPATITKTETFTAQPSLDIWPNPTAGGQSIHVGLSHFTGAAEIQLVDAKGRILVRRKVEASANISIETQSLPSGIYLIKAIGQGATLQQRVVIQ